MFIRFNLKRYENTLNALSTLNVEDYASFISAKHSLIVLRQSDVHYIIFDNNPANPATHRVRQDEACEIIHYHLQNNENDAIQFKKISNPFAKPIDRTLLMFKSLDLSIQELFATPDAVVNVEDKLYVAAKISKDAADYHGRLFPALRAQDKNLTDHDLMILNLLEAGNKKSSI